jgi:hypothetical protein
MTYPTEKVDMAPIFVVGAPRSGTTLMATILAGHSQIFAPAPGETHYFHDMWTRRKKFGTLEDERGLSLAAERLLTIFDRWDNSEAQKIVNAVISKDALLNRARALGKGYDALYYAFTSMLAESAGKRYYCDDTPKHLFYLHTIFDLFPHAKAVGCIRDPRDFLCSYKYYWKKAGDSNRIKALYHPVITSLLWQGSSNLLLKHAEKCCRDRLIIVRYESLVQKHEAEVRRICHFLGFEYSDNMLGIESHNSSFEQSSSHGIFTTSMGRWRTFLSPEEIWCVQTLNRGNMRDLHYEPEDVSPSKKALLLTVLNTPFAFAKAIKANSAKTGPLIKYVMRRLISLIRR